MAIYVMSDIHGQAEAFYKTLDLIKFSRNDTLYVLGDVIDRGQHGILILSQIMNCQNMHMLLGNHEYMMLRAFAFSELEVWFRNGGEQTLEDYNKLGAGEQGCLVDYMLSLDFEKDITCASRKYKLVHGRPFSEHPRSGVYQPSWLSDLSPREQMLWEEMSAPYTSTEHTVVFGHRCTKHYQEGTPFKIYNGPGMIGIDCGCAHMKHPGRLGCLRLNDLKEFYTEI